MTPFKSYLIRYVFILFCAFVTLPILLAGCKQKGEGSGALTGDTIADGQCLVKLNCTKCHALVAVNALTKDVWFYHSLPSMAHYFGLTPYMDGYYKSDSTQSKLTLEQWQAIVAYYKKLAPDTLPRANAPTPVVNDWAGFTLKTPSAVNAVTYTTMVAFNPDNHKIYTSDLLGQNLMEWGSDLKMTNNVKLPYPAVGATFFKDKAGKSQGLFSSIGQIEPIDFPNGKIVSVNLADKKWNAKLFAGDLARPVQTIAGDFNKDGLIDWVVLGQGHLKGGVSLFTQNKANGYDRTEISTQPGAVEAVTGDFNKDGWPDLMILFGSGDEGLQLFLNNKKGGFTAKKLLTFPPVYGSSSFQLTDLDKDGNLDLIYTVGYNYRDSRILKPYHGLYLFKNTGNWNFKQQWFYPINGCTKAIAADFEGNGKPDIAVSAFFADMKNNPAEEFLYFEQDKPFVFKPHAVPVSKYGRWMSMDVGDYNNDGKPDIILGNYSSGFMFQPGLTPFWAKNLPFIVLENSFKKQ